MASRAGAVEAAGLPLDLTGVVFELPLYSREAPGPGALPLAIKDSRMSHPGSPTGWQPGRHSTLCQYNRYIWGITISRGHVDVF